MVITVENVKETKVSESQKHHCKLKVFEHFNGKIEAECVRSLGAFDQHVLSAPVFPQQFKETENETVGNYGLVKKGQADTLKKESNRGIKFLIY